MNYSKRKYLRIIHHWPCSGGTLISKCIASLSNIIFLNEVHPYAYLRFMQNNEKQYLPTDLIQQLSFKRNGANANICNAAFVGAIAEANETIIKMNKILVIRDHSHVDFFIGPFPRKESLIHELFHDKYNLKSIFTVRHPLDSWLSMKNNSWEKFIQFNNFDEYCLRIKNMIIAMKDKPIIHYEQFCLDPQSVFKIICSELKLKYDKNFIKKFHTICLSGDSGRTSSSIEFKERRQFSDELKKIIYNSQNYLEICEKLNYEHKYDGNYPYLIK